VRRSPCELYQKFLICHPDGYGDEQIRDIVVGQQLDFLGMPYLARLRVGLARPVPFYPVDQLHRPSQRFLIREGLRLFFHPDRSMVRALELLGDPRAKEMIETGAMSGHQPVWVASLLRRRGIGATTEAVERYLEHFYDLRAVDSSELKLLAELRTVQQPSADPHEQVMLAAAFNPQNLYSNLHRVTAQQAATPLAAIMYEMRMGLMPSALELGKIASAARTAATAAVLDSLLRGDLPERARDFALTAKVMGEIVDSVGDPELELNEGLRAILLDTDAYQVPLLSQLSGGEHTVDLQPTTRAVEDAVFTDGEQVEEQGEADDDQPY
jgi:hypothetical protein